MKCEACEELKLGKRWDEDGCTTLQKSAIKIHEKSEEHKFAMVRWEDIYFPRGNIMPIEQHIQTMVEKMYLYIDYYEISIFHHME